MRDVKQHLEQLVDGSRDGLLGLSHGIHAAPEIRFEERRGGKILMLDGGAFDGVHAAMMVHPSPDERAHPDNLAVSHFLVRYQGYAAHASSWPQLGVNAADALTVAQVAIGLLRQQSTRYDQVHGITTKGGDAPNIIPAEAVARYYVRAEDRQKLAALKARVERCFEAGAGAAGGTP